MISAFGVDHGYGEIEKAIPGLARVGSALAGGASKMGRGLTRAGVTNAKAGKAMSMGAKPGFESGMGRGLTSRGNALIGAGGSLRKLSAGMAKRPGLTGGVAVGGGGAAALGAGMAGHRRYGQ